MARLPEPLRRRAEWSFVRFVRGVYAGDPPETWTPDLPLDLARGLTGTGAARPMLEHVAPLIAKGTWRFLARSGGFRKREVVVKARARSGRLWEEPVWGAEPLRVTGATIAWLAAIHDELVDGRSNAEAPVAIAGPISAGALSPGDRLALTAALGALFRPGSRALGTNAKNLSGALPVFLLTNPSQTPAAPEIRIAEDHESTALQFFDDTIAGAWVDEVQRLRVRTTVAEQTASFQRLGRIVGAIFMASNTAGGDQVHLLSPVVRFFPKLWRELGGMDGIGDWIGRASEGLSTRSERENYEFRFGDLLNYGVMLDDRVQQVLQTPWPDRTESQKRLVAEHETRYREIRDEVRTLARRFRRELG